MTASQHQLRAKFPKHLHVITHFALHKVTLTLHQDTKGILIKCTSIRNYKWNQIPLMKILNNILFNVLIKVGTTPISTCIKSFNLYYNPETEAFLSILVVRKL